MGGEPREERRVLEAGLAPDMDHRQLTRAQEPGKGVRAALPQKSILRLIYYSFNALKFTILISILTFEAKPCPG